MRIASLLPSTTEIVYALGRGDDLVARTHECDHPEAARAVKPVTSDLLDRKLPAAEIDQAVTTGMRDEHTIYQLDAAALRSLEPDVVLTQSLCGVCAVPTTMVHEALCVMPAQAQIVSADPTTLEGVLASIIDIGTAIGEEAEARTLAARLRSRLNWIASTVEPLDRPRVAIIEWPDPLYAPGHWVPDMVEAAGGSNCFGASGEPSRRVTIDDLATARPDVIVLGFCGFNLYETQARFRELTANPKWERATRHAQIFAVDGSAFVSRPGPRVVEGVELLAWALHRPHPDMKPAVGAGAKLIEAGWVDLSALPVREAVA